MGNFLKVLTRRTVASKISMWAILHIDPLGAKTGGWLCDTWTERDADAADMLQPELHWLAKEDNKLHRARISGMSGIEVFAVDAEIEPRREAFIRATLAKWEQEYLDTEAERLRDKNPY